MSHTTVTQVSGLTSGNIKSKIKFQKNFTSWIVTTYFRRRLADGCCSEEIRISQDLSARRTMCLSAEDGLIVPERTATTTMCCYVHCTCLLLYPRSCSGMWCWPAVCWAISPHGNTRNMWHGIVLVSVVPGVILRFVQLRTFCCWQVISASIPRRMSVSAAVFLLQLDSVAQFVSCSLRRYSMRQRCVKFYPSKRNLVKFISHHDRVSA